MGYRQTSLGPKVELSELGADLGALVSSGDADSLHTHGTLVRSGRLSPMPIADYVGAGNLYVPVCRNVVSGNNWFTFLGDPTDATRGFRVVLNKYGNIHAINGAYEGRLRPAWYAPFTPTTTGGGISTGTNSYFRYYIYNGAGKYCQWTVPAAGVGCNRIVVNYWRQSGGGSVILAINGQTVGSVDCNGTTAHDQTQEFTLGAPLALNDTVRITWAAGTANVYGFWAHSTTGNWAAPSHRILTDEIEIIAPASAVEGAMFFGPAGQSGKWFMSSHQGSSNGSQVDVTETVVTPVGWDTTGGYGVGSGGRAEITRTSTLQYDDDPLTNIATAQEQYLLGPTGLSYWGRILTTAIVDSTVRYPGMLPLARATDLVFSDSGLAVDPTGDESETSKFCPVTRLWGGAVGDAAFYARLLRCSEFQEYSTLEPRVALVKMYFRWRALTAVPADTVWEWALAFCGTRRACV